MTRYFLDTTAHIERWAGDAEAQEYVRTALGGDVHATSLHAQREWKHIIEGTCVDILNALRRKPADLSAVLAALSQGWGRTAGHRLRVLSMITAGENNLNRELMEIRAERYLRVQADEMFRSQIDEVRAGSECGLAANEAGRDEDGKWTFGNPETGSQWCKKTDQICRQDDALDGKEDELRLAADTLEASSGHRPTARVIRDAADNRGARKGKPCYSKLGDVSLALECAGNEVLLTTDESFELMAPALGFKVERFNATLPP